MGKESPNIVKKKPETFPVKIQHLAGKIALLAKIGEAKEFMTGMELREWRPCRRAESRFFRWKRSYCQASTCHILNR